MTDHQGITWPVRGQEALFDGVDYHQAHTDLPWVPESLLSTDDLIDATIGHQWPDADTTPSTSNDAGADGSPGWGAVQ